MLLTLNKSFYLLLLLEAIIQTAFAPIIVPLVSQCIFVMTMLDLDRVSLFTLFVAFHHMPRQNVLAIEGNTTITTFVRSITEFKIQFIIFANWGDEIIFKFPLWLIYYMLRKYEKWVDDTYFYLKWRLSWSIMFPLVVKALLQIPH